MTQEATPVGGEAVPAPENPADVFTQLAEEAFGIKDEEEEQPAEGEEAPPEEAADETAAEEEADDLPPIDAPVSWDAEAKEVFKSLPREAQEIVQKREAERERFVQQKSQEASRARTEAEQAAIQQLAQIEQGYAEHYSKIAEQILPQRPNPMLLQQDPAAFYAQQYAYENATAQQRELQQLANQHAEQAKAREAQAEQARLADEHRLIVEQFPEYADPTTGPKLQAELSSVARELGYPPELIAQARASDIIAMRKASEWKAKADQLDRLNAKKMEKVRAAKGLPNVAKPGVSHAPDQLRARNAQAALEVAKSSKDRNVQGAAFFDYLTSTGQLR
jgi:hypothetical protein